MKRTKSGAAVALLALMPLLIAAAGAGGQATVAAVEGPGLTIYTENMALVRTELDYILETGTHTVRVDGLPTQLDPTTLLVIDPQVTLLGAHSFRTYQSSSEGAGASIDLDLEVSGRLDTLHLAYITSGLSWSSTYAMLVGPDDATARIDGYATIVNGSGTGYQGAEVQLLAGSINRGGAGGRVMADMMYAARERAVQAESPALSEAAFSGYHLYTVSEPVSLRSGEARRIRMLGADEVSVERQYVLVQQFNYFQQYPEPQTQPVSMRYRVERPEGTDFGDAPLPAGSVHLYQTDDQGRLQLLGISSIPNTPAEEELTLGIGQAFDVVATRTQTDFARPGNDVYESEWRIELRNRSDDDVTVQVIEQVRGDWQILRSTHQAETLSAGAVQFRVPVPAGGEATLEYRISVRN